MKKKIIIFLGATAVCWLSLITNSYAKELTAEEIVKEVDRVLTPGKDTTAVVRMIITTSTGEKRILKMKILSTVEPERTFIRYLEPSRIRGLGYLIVGGGENMWAFFPSTKRVRHLASHIKRRGIEGSDFSFEDISSNSSLSKDYIPKLLGKDRVEGEEVYVLELIAKAKDLAYSKLNIWVRTENFVPVKQEFFDLKRKPLKVLYYKNIRKIQGYWTPKLFEMYNIQKNSYSSIVVDEMEYDTGISDDVFTERNLRNW